MLNTIDDFTSKGMHQHTPGPGHWDPSSTQIPNGLVIQLADGCPVRAANIICINLKLRFGVRGGGIGKQKIFVGLLGICFLCYLTHVDAAMEDAAGLIVQNPIEVFMAFGVRLGMIHDHVVVDDLIALGE